MAKNNDLISCNIAGISIKTYGSNTKNKERDFLAVFVALLYTDFHDAYGIIEAYEPCFSIYVDNFGGDSLSDVVFYYSGGYWTTGNFCFLYDDLSGDAWNHDDFDSDFRTICL